MGEEGGLTPEQEEEIAERVLRRRKEEAARERAAREEAINRHIDQQKEARQQLVSSIESRLTHCPACGNVFESDLVEDSEYDRYENYYEWVERQCTYCGRATRLDLPPIQHHIPGL